MPSTEPTNSSHRFLKNRWWGLLCLAIWLIATGYFFTPTNHSFDHIAGGILFAKVSPGETAVIINLPSRFLIYLMDEKHLSYRTGKQDEKRWPFPAVIENNRMTIQGISFDLSQDEIQSMWGERKGVTVLDNGEDVKEITIPRDMIMHSISNVYSIKDNTVVDHYVEDLNTTGAIFATFAILIVYFIGAALRKAK